MKVRRPDDLRTEQSPELKYEGAIYDVRRIYEGKEGGRKGRAGNYIALKLPRKGSLARNLL